MLPRSDSTRSKEHRTRLPFGLRNTATIYREAIQSESFFDFEKDLDDLLHTRLDKKKEATACREAPIFDYYLGSDDDTETVISTSRGRMISTPQDRLVYWKVLKPFELHYNDTRLVVILQELLFQEGRPLSPVREESVINTILVEYSSDEHTSERFVFMASHGPKVEVSDRHNNELPTEVSVDEETAEAGNEEEAQRTARRLRNQKREKHKRNAIERQDWLARNLDAQFAAAEEVGFRTPIANIATAAALLTNHEDPAIRRALRLSQRAWMQLDTQNPAPSIHRDGKQEINSHPQRSRTLGGRHQKPAGGDHDSNDAPQGDHSAGRSIQPLLGDQ